MSSVNGQDPKISLIASNRVNEIFKRHQFDDDEPIPLPVSHTLSLVNDLTCHWV